MALTEENPGYKWVGTRPIRPDGVEKVTGKARFGADLALPGMLHGKIVRSPHAHARIASIDTTAAEAMPGVKAVITGSDFPDLAANGAHPSAIDVANNAIARDKVLYEGHVVAAVAAITREQAEAAAKAVEVTYETLPHVLSVDEAMAEDAPVLHENMITKGVEPAPEQPSNIASRVVHERGELDQGFGEADVVIEREFTTKPVHQGYIEPHAAVADANSDGRAHVWCSSQGHFQMRADTASVFVNSPCPSTFTGLRRLAIRPAALSSSGDTSPSKDSRSRTLTTWNSTRLKFLKPRLGIRRMSGICPPSKRGCTLAPERDFCPFWPRVAVFPRPDPGPLPPRFWFLREPRVGVKS